MARYPFDDTWRFCLSNPDKLDELHFALTPEFDDSSWRELSVPHDWSIECPRLPTHPSGPNGGFFIDGMGWYRKRFDAPTAWKEQRVLLEFEGAYHNAELWLNGRVLAEHPYGYTGFFVDLTDLLKFDQPNVLAVRLNSSGSPHTRWYAGSGIYRHVWLHVNPMVYLEPWGTAITTPEVTAQQATIHLKTEIRNTRVQDITAALSWTVLAPDGSEVTSASQTVNAAAGERVTLEQTVAVQTPVRWSVDAPQLYHLKTCLTENGERQEEEIPFGIRSIRFTAAEGFVLNEEALLLKGGCVHHDCGPLGAQSLNRAEERKVELLKASGYNAVRCAHNPPAPAFLDACDRLGMLVMDEAFDVWQLEKIPFDYHRDFNDWWQRDLDSMLRRDRNHPCIILWSIGNELIERGFPEGTRITGMLADHVRAMEPTRPVTAGICNLWGAGPWRTLDPSFALLDVCGYNYEVGASIDDHKLHPERVIVATESFPNQSFEYWQAVEQYPHLAGDFVWTALDYLGESGIGRTFEEGKSTGHMPGWPWHVANCGDIDLCGWKRPQSYYRDVLWGRSNKPFVAVHPPLPEGMKIEVSAWGWHDVQPSWTWPDATGKTLQVDVYCDADDVELQLNGHSLGRQPATAQQRFIATFNVPYEPGTVKAIARRRGNVVSESILHTTGAATQLAMEVDRARIEVSPDDLAYITVKALDADGMWVPMATHSIAFTLQGPGTLAAVASADPCSTESYRGNVRQLWRGRALAVIRPNGQPGEITLEAHADGLVGSALTVSVE